MKPSTRLSRGEHLERVLIPVTGSASVPGLVRVAHAMNSCYGGQTVLLGLVEVPEGHSLSEGTLRARRKRASLRRLAGHYPDYHLTSDVRTDHAGHQAIRQWLRSGEPTLVLLAWGRGAGSSATSLARSLAPDPPCDIAAVRGELGDNVKSVLVPARGGPHARLALMVGEAIAQQHGATLTLVHMSLDHWTPKRRQREERFFAQIRDQVRHAKVQELQLQGPFVDKALIDESARHDVMVMGAGARDEPSRHLLGNIPDVVLRRAHCPVIVTKTKEPVTAETFESPPTERQESDLSDLVDRWFAENTFHSHEFRDIRYLVDLKERQGKTLSLVLPTLNEEKTVGKIIDKIKRSLVDQCPLIDELIVIDSESEDRTVQIARDLGATVYPHPQLLAGRGSHQGKGEALWKSLYVTKGDIIVWIDSDITGIHPKFVYGLVGPLLSRERLGFVKGFYRRPLRLGSQLLTTGGGRVTELTARPLINLFYPQLSGLVQPLAGEMAGRREILESVPFFTGYGVETGLLIDILEQHGLGAIAQTDLENRVHRNQSLLSLSKMAFAIVQVVVKRLGDRKRLQLLEEMNRSMKLIHYSRDELSLEVKEIQEYERPPIITLGEYRERHPR